MEWNNFTFADLGYFFLQIIQGKFAKFSCQSKMTRLGHFIFKKNEKLFFLVIENHF